MVRLRVHKLLTPLIFLTCMACAHVISPEIRQTARNDLSFPVVLKDPAAHIGEIVILGGVIIETTNQPEGTMITVLETPLDSRGRPLDERLSRGRFIARTAAYLDPEIYRKGRRTTLAGEVVGEEVRPIGEIYYGYPLVEIKEIHLVERGDRPYFFPSIGIGFGYVHR